MSLYNRITTCVVVYIFILKRKIALEINTQQKKNMNICPLREEKTKKKNKKITKMYLNNKSKPWSSVEVHPILAVSDELCTYNEIKENTFQITLNVHTDYKNNFLFRYFLTANKLHISNVKSSHLVLQSFRIIIINVPPPLLYKYGDFFFDVFYTGDVDENQRKGRREKYVFKKRIFTHYFFVL